MTLSKCPSNFEDEELNESEYVIAQAQARAIEVMAESKGKGIVYMCISVPILIGLMLVLQTIAACQHVTLDIDKQIPLMLVGVVPAVLVVSYKKNGNGKS